VLRPLGTSNESTSFQQPLLPIAASVSIGSSPDGAPATLSPAQLQSATKAQTTSAPRPHRFPSTPSNALANKDRLIRPPYGCPCTCSCNRRAGATVSGSRS